MQSAALYARAAKFLIIIRYSFKRLLLLAMVRSVDNPILIL